MTCVECGSQMELQTWYLCTACGGVDSSARIASLKLSIDNIDLELAEINLKINHLSDNSIALIKQVKKITKLLMEERSHEHTND